MAAADCGLLLEVVGKVESKRSVGLTPFAAISGTTRAALTIQYLS